MKKCLFVLFIAASFLHASGQNNWEKFLEEGGGERYFSFTFDSKYQLEQLDRVISIDLVDGENVIAWANKKGFEEFLKFGIEYEFIPLDLDFDPVMHDVDNLEMLRQWNSYPTYEAYEAMMYQFQTDHPSKCNVHNIGTLNSGRKLLGVQININDEPKPQFLYSATMHGDELAGYVLSLRLIDHLLTQYGIDPFITRLVDSVEIWIFPQANPDGTYHGGNHTVMSSRRGNANNVDLNRNYPDPKAGPNPDGNAWQPETIVFMDLAGENRFTMGANMHGGAEVCNYPWDTWQRLTADDAWWVYVCREYADTAQFYSPTGYMSQFNNGITNGFAWYSITGGRQDYMNYFHGCREFTLELSNVKKLPASQLEAHWQYNYRSFLNYIEQSLYGVRGLVTDAVTGEALEAKVYISGHDIDSSHVYTAMPYGNYHRLLFTGNYDITFLSPCHHPVTIENVSVTNRQTTWLNVALDPLPAHANFTVSQTKINPEQSIVFNDLSCGVIQQWNWSFPGGIPSSSTDPDPEAMYLFPGSYDVQLIVSDGTVIDTLTRHDYIKVAPSFNMSNNTITICNAFFYDSGGPNRNYSNNENYTMTFIPATAGAMIMADFIFFDVEQSFNCNYDFLKIYDGIDNTAPLIGTYCGTNSPGLITATNTDGALTFHFKSDGSKTKPGWEAIINCQYPEEPPVPEFTANITQVYTGDTVYFFDMSTGNPVAWEWTFAGGVPEHSTGQYPTVTYPVAGSYPVSLYVTNEFGTSHLVIDNYITVDSGVGIFRPGLISEFIVFPNPVTSGVVHVRAGDVISSISVINLLGQELLMDEPKAYHTRLDLSGLQQGIYLIRVQMAKGIATRKVYIF